MIEVCGDAFLLGAWTPQELHHAGGQPEHLGAKWATKEAAMKALGIGLGDISPLDVEVVMVSEHQPNVILYGAAAAASDRLGITTWCVSLMADGRWALATAIALADQN